MRPCAHRVASHHQFNPIVVGSLELKSCSAGGGRVCTVPGRWVDLETEKWIMGASDALPPSFTYDAHLPIPPPPPQGFVKEPISVSTLRESSCITYLHVWASKCTRTLDRQHHGRGYISTNVDKMSLGFGIDCQGWLGAPSSRMQMSCGCSGARCHRS